ncbi:MAG: TIGR04086 family membrane protein [Clostridia bacterium]|nr:TIGR04086 family membrane protein [Clostridia bacterium]
MGNERVYGNGFFTVIKAALVALAVSLLSAVIFAVVLRAAPLSSGTIYTVNQVLKVLSVIIGVFACVRGEKGWLRGGATGLLFSAFSYLAFSALGGDFSLTWLIFIELAITFLAGAISGSLAVNLRK